MPSDHCPASIRIGTSGWHYKHWKNVFYPAKTATRDWLPLYAKHFDTVELNSVFYRFPTENAVLQWKNIAPANFLFAVKASRFLTHRKKLTGPPDAVEKLLGRAGLLGDKLGPILFQLPPRWKANPDRLASFADWLPADKYNFVFEFRDASWYSDAVLRVLTERNLSFCVHDWGDAASPTLLTGRIGYIRLHGPVKPYTGKYTLKQLWPWIELICSWRSKVEQIFVFFNNDQEAFAVQNAQQLKKALTKTLGRR
jgi:uncharacterized protein YecE (DUF72 family)